MGLSETMELLTLYARKEPSIEGVPNAKDVTLWRKYRTSDFPNATAKLIQEGPRLEDGTLLFPVCRYPYYSSGRPTKRNKYVTYNCFRYKLQWI